MIRLPYSLLQLCCRIGLLIQLVVLGTVGTSAAAAASAVTSAIDSVVHVTITVHISPLSVRKEAFELLTRVPGVAAKPAPW